MFVLISKKTNQPLFTIHAKTQEEAVAMAQSIITSKKVRNTMRLTHRPASEVLRATPTDTQPGLPHKDLGGNYRCKRCGGTGKYGKHGTCYNCDGAGMVSPDQAKQLAEARDEYWASQCRADQASAEASARANA